MKNTFGNIKTLFGTFETNAALQLKKGNKAAGTRARKAALELIKQLKDYRKLSVEADKK